MNKILKIANVLAMSGIALSATLLTTTASAEYPEKPVSYVVPFPPGDLEDVLTRMIADGFQKDYGVAAAVINKPGGGGGPFPGAVEVSKAKADGYTVGSFVSDVVTVGHTIGIPDLASQPFEPLGTFLTYPFVIVAGENAPYDDIDGLAKYAQKNELALGHFGSVLLPTKITMALAKDKGFEFGSEAAFDALDCNTLASGDADVMNTTLQLILPCLDKVKVIASIGDERIPLTPDAPTVKELSPKLDVALWNGLFVHKDTPQDVREKIIASAKKVIASDAAKKLAAETGALIYWKDAADVSKQIESDIEVLKVIDEML